MQESSDPSDMSSDTNNPLPASSPEGSFDICDEARRIVEAATADGVVLRLVGSAACRICCDEAGPLFDELQREAPGDIDFAGARKQSHKITQVMERLGYENDRGVIIASEGARHIYYHPQSKHVIDVFTDELDFNHKIDLRKRLELCPVTLSPSDLLLSKLQIVEITLKDLKDAFVLLSRFEIDPENKNGKPYFDGSYLVSVLSDDWGFYHTVTTNLRKLQGQIPGFNVTDPIRPVVEARLMQLIKMIEEAPKPLRWKMRAKLGTKTRWYQVVEDKADTF